MIFETFLKRAVDVVACLVALPIVLPLCLLLMLLIRLESRGSPLFVQRRMGRRARPFRMLKLRTMRADTTNLPSHEVGQESITRLGRSLRRLKLDELPQVLNVLTGSMSLVGPRPCLPSQAELIAAREARGLFRLRPGVTGPAQLVGVDMSQPVTLAEVEAEYFSRSTLRSDMSLIFRTIFGAGSGDPALAPRDR
jgi:O-antigen biosynthesis protein WbqP